VQRPVIVLFLSSFTLIVTGLVQSAASDQQSTETSLPGPDQLVRLQPC